MSKLTDKEWVELVRKCVEYCNKGLRIGQSYMNALHDVRDDLYIEITNTEADCFYDDLKIVQFIKKLNE